MSLRDRAADAEQRFVVETLVLAHVLRTRSADQQADGARDTLSVDHTALHAGWLRWRDDHDSALPWQRVDRRKEFLDRVARLGDRELGVWLWETALGLNERLTPADLEALGGPRSAREDFLVWACESLPIDEVLKRASTLDETDAQWVFDSCLARLGDASLPVLRDWTKADRGSRVRQQALAGLLKHPEGPGRRAVLVGLWQDEDFALVRAAMQGARGWELDAEEQGAWHRAWMRWEASERLALLRRMRVDQLPRETVQECLRWVREDARADPYLIEVISKRVPKAEVLPVLMAGWERDLALAEARWNAPQGADPNAGLVRLVAWITGLGRVHPPALWQQPARDWPRRIAFLRSPAGKGASFALGKALLAQVASHAGGRAWLREQVGLASDWPRRLRVEAVLQLAPFAHEEAGDDLGDWLREVYRSDYAGLGVVLRERWWKAVGQRPEDWREELFQEASDRRAPGTVREAAMRALAERNEWMPLLDLVAGERPGEGVWLAAGVVTHWDDPRVAPALRERIERAAQAVRAGGREAELAEETLVALQIALVQGGHWTAEDGRNALLAADLRFAEALQARLAGEAKPEHWPRELRLCAHLAAQKQLSATIAVQEDRWLRLPGPFLAQLAEAAWIGRDLEATYDLARMAEIAIAGEAVDGPGWNAAITVARVRFLLAWQTEDWRRAMAYSLKLWHRVQRGGRAARGLEGTLGVLDWRAGVDPGAALLAGAWQAAGWLAIEEGNWSRARWAARQAQVWRGRSVWPEAMQARLEAVLAGHPAGKR